MISKINHIQQTAAIQSDILNEKRDAITNYYYDLIINMPKVAPSVAKQIKDSLTILILFKIKKPYRNFGLMQFKPTIENPEKATYEFQNVYADLKEIWIYNKVTGEVLLKTKATNPE